MQSYSETPLLVKIVLPDFDVHLVGIATVSAVGRGHDEPN